MRQLSVEAVKREEAREVTAEEVERRARVCMWDVWWRWALKRGSISEERHQHRGRPRMLKGEANRLFRNRDLLA